MPVFSWKYCKHPGGPPLSSPHMYWIALILIDLDVVVSAVSNANVISIQSTVSRTTVKKNCEIVFANVYKIQKYNN